MIGRGRLEVYDDFPAALPYYSNFWYGPATGGASATPISLSADRIYLMPMQVFHPRRFTAIGVVVDSTVAGDAALGIYTVDQNGSPDVLLAEGDAVVTLNAGSVSATISQMLMPGWYYLAINPEVNVDVDAILTPYVSGGFGSITAHLIPWTYWRVVYTYTGTLPATKADFGVAASLGSISATSKMASVALLAE